jgi:hypothetical protein
MPSVDLNYCILHTFFHCKKIAHAEKRKLKKSINVEGGKKNFKNYISNAPKQSFLTVLVNFLLAD